MRALVSIGIVATIAARVALADEYAVVVHRPIRITVASAERLQSICRVGRIVRACTFFAGESLLCHCRAVGEEWRLTARASFRPVMYLGPYPALALHETMHVEDVKLRLERYLRSLVAQTFPSESDCLAAASAASEETAFLHRMNEYRRESNAKYGCSPIGGDDRPSR